MTIRELMDKLHSLNAKNDFDYTSVYVETDDTEHVKVKSFTLKYLTEINEKDEDKSPVRLILEG